MPGLIPEDSIIPPPLSETLGASIPVPPPPPARKSLPQNTAFAKARTAGAAAAKRRREEALEKELAEVDELADHSKPLPPTPRHKRTIGDMLSAEEIAAGVNILKPLTRNRAALPYRSKQNKPLSPMPTKKQKHTSFFDGNSSAGLDKLFDDSAVPSKVHISAYRPKEKVVLHKPAFVKRTAAFADPANKEEDAYYRAGFDAGTLAREAGLPVPSRMPGWKVGRPGAARWLHGARDGYGTAAALHARSAANAAKTEKILDRGRRKSPAAKKARKAPSKSKSPAKKRNASKSKTPRRVSKPGSLTPKRGASKSKSPKAKKARKCPSLQKVKAELAVVKLQLAEARKSKSKSPAVAKKKSSSEKKPAPKKKKTTGKKKACCKGCSKKKGGACAAKSGSSCLKTTPVSVAAKDTERVSRESAGIPSNLICVKSSANVAKFKNREVKSHFTGGKKVKACVQLASSKACKARKAVLGH